MQRILLISVRFHDGRYHGTGDWPPSSARLFQALVAGIGQDGPLGDEASKPLEWLEELDPPVIAAPLMVEGQAVTNYVPNNDLDAVGGDPRRIGSIRTAKVWKPKLFNQELTFHYAWQFEGTDGSLAHAQRICECAERLYQLGRGIDQAWAFGDIIESPKLEEILIAYRGVVHHPTSGRHGTVLASPQKGSLKSLKDRHETMSQRFAVQGQGRAVKLQFAQAPKPRFAATAYDNPTSANRAVGALKRAFNWAVEEEHIPKNPLAHVRKPKSLVRDRTLTPDERRLILSKIVGPAFRTFVNAMTLTGCRPGEVARVTAADVDLERGLWVLTKHKTATKTGRPRIVYLPPEAVELTRGLMAKRPDGPLFVNSRRKPWTRNAVRIRFRNLRERFPELKGIVAYSYRSSFATDALESGVPDATVAALLGHTNTATLHKHYARLSGRLDHLKDAAEKATRPKAGDGPGGTPG